MENPLISIIIPIYKVEKYLCKCIDSVLQQLYENIEVILIDDGSPDLCGDICDGYAEADSRIKAIHQRNSGLSAARNAGIAIAKGSYFLFVDSDDWVEVDICSSAINDLLDHDADIVIFGYKEIDENGKLIKTNNSHRDMELTSAQAIESLIKEDLDIGNYAWNKLYKREMFQGVEYPPGRLWEDIGTTYLLFHNAKKIYLTNRVLYNYLKRTTSITGIQDIRGEKDIFEQRKIQFDFLRQFYPDISEFALPLLISTALHVCTRLSGDTQYYNVTKAAEKFLYENKKNIKEKNLTNIKIQLFYFSKSLLVFLWRCSNKHKKLAALGKKLFKIVNEIKGESVNGGQR